MKYYTPVKRSQVGQIVLYMLTDDDAQQIMRRRTNGADIASKIKNGIWPVGAQAHIGNGVQAGDVFPMLIVRVIETEHGSMFGSTYGAVNGKVELDGTDSLWMTSVTQAKDPAQRSEFKGHWFVQTQKS